MHGSMKTISGAAMRTPEYYLNIEKTLERVSDILDKSGLAYFVSLAEKKEGAGSYNLTHGKIGDSHYSYELTVRATVHALSQYSKTGQVKWLKFIAKKLGYKIEVTE